MVVQEGCIKMYFIFNGVDSRDLGLYVKDIPFDMMASRRVDTLVLPTIDGTLYRDNDTYESYTLSIECILKDSLTTENVKKIKNTFKVGKGDLILSTRPNNIYKAVLKSQLNFTEMLQYTGSCLLTFEIQPFSFITEGQNAIKVTKNMTIKNLGNYSSNPLFKAVGGNGLVTINVNGHTMAFKGVNSTFYVDCELEDVYGDGGKNLNNFMDLESDFISLPTDSFTVTYTGLTELYITPRWREL